MVLEAALCSLPPADSPIVLPWSASVASCPGWLCSCLLSDHWLWSYFLPAFPSCALCFQTLVISHHTSAQKHPRLFITWGNISAPVGYIRFTWDTYKTKPISVWMWASCPALRCSGASRTQRGRLESGLGRSFSYFSGCMHPHMDCRRQVLLPVDVQKKSPRLDISAPPKPLGLLTLQALRPT